MEPGYKESISHVTIEEVCNDHNNNISYCVCLNFDEPLEIDHKDMCPKVYFWGVFFVDHSKLEVVSQNCWINLMTDDFENLWKSE